VVELSKIQKSKNKEVIITVRTTKEDKEWLDKHNISPSLFFDEAIFDLKERMKKNVHRKVCVVCGKPSQLLNLGLGMETFSFCSQKCMNIYVVNHPNGGGLEVKGNRIYVV